MKRLASILGLLGCLHATAAEVIPPAPARYFNDYANVVSSATAGRLNQTLADFERQTSSQIVVAVYPTMQSDSSLEDYTVRVARAWRVGQQAKNNGAILFVFVQDRKLFIQVGYGLEAVIPDALCKRITDDEIMPRFKSGDYGGGLSAGVTAMMAAAKGEYKGTGRTVADVKGYSSSRYGWFEILWRIGIGLVICYLLIRGFAADRRGGGGGGWMIGGGGFGGWSGGGGGGFSGGGGGGGFSGGGGGFSGGGGSFGGGGAGGSW